MEPSPTGLDHIVFTSNALRPVFFRPEIEAASGTAAPPADSDNDLDGCCLPVDTPTADEDLPVAEGGVG